MSDKTEVTNHSVSDEHGSDGETLVFGTIPHCNCVVTVRSSFVRPVDSTLVPAFLLGGSQFTTLNTSVVHLYSAELSNAPVLVLPGQILRRFNGN